jgi:DNA-binding CsgD family transcriptional regulator
MKADDFSVEELKNGYEYSDKEGGECICRYCGERFTQGEIYPINGHFYEYRKAAMQHVYLVHGAPLETLLKSESKYMTLTDNQKQILLLMGKGLSDNEIAKQLEVTPSTIRHQKFMFREKVKQARMLLAAYELAEENTILGDNLIPIHSGATMVDDRYITTEEEKKKILDTAFFTLEPLKLKGFPAKEKKKIVVLKKIAESFVKGRHYEEKELNSILKSIYSDYPTLRRYLIEYGFMDRTTDCKEYWLTM